ncbi:MAG TPA: FAD-dependent oxidoreductase, partial [Trebonia sp.]
ARPPAHRGVRGVAPHYLTGLDQREIYGQAYRVKDDITIADLTARTRHVVSRENDVVRNQLTRNRVTIIAGLAYFVGPHAVEIDDGAGRTRKVTADKIVIATGTRPARPSSVAFDEKTIIGGTASRGRDGHPPQRQEDPGGHRPVLRRPPGHDRRTQPARRRARRGRPGPDLRR